MYLYRRNEKKPIKRVAWLMISSVIAAAVLTLAIYNYIDKIGERLTINISDAKAADCIIVLGAGVVGDKPSVVLKNRLDKAYEVYALGSTDKIIVSGDHGRDSYDEVNVMRNYLIKLGVPKDNIFMDHAGFSTYESMYRARDIFGVETAIVVTQRLHLRRALYIGEKLGISCMGVEADNAPAASTAIQGVREYPARVKAFIDCQMLHPKPKYLGDVIPITGSGIVTEG